MTVLSSSQSRYLARAVDAYADQLKNAHGPYRDSAISFLRDHGITGELAQEYKLGLVADPLPGDERFRGAVVIPFLPPRGIRNASIAKVKFRMFDGPRKYDQHKGWPHRLFNTQAFFNAGSAIGIAEGELDAITASEYLLPTMGCPGADAWKDYWTSILKDFTRVYILGDGDDAGRQFASDMAEIIGWRARVVPFPDGADVCSMAASGGLDPIRQVISTSNEES